MPITDNVNVSNSEDTDTAHLPKLKTRPDWMKPIPKEDIPATPEPDCSFLLMSFLNLRTIGLTHLPAQTSSLLKGQVTEKATWRSRPSSTTMFRSNSSRKQSASYSEQPIKDMPITDNENVSNSEDTDTAHLPKLKTRPDWMKPIPKEDIPSTPEPDCSFLLMSFLNLRTIGLTHLPARIKI
uniref:Uncharacterized protein n=1 Tax=Tanacetum cinerariifolium TaxID=118510 RepID=A0A699L4V3_TANCI|nr:hypothetical protein [Tanacetum cinerariifolium]